MIKSSIKSVVVPIALTSFIMLDGCSKDEATPKSQTDLLVGD